MTKRVTISLSKDIKSKFIEQLSKIQAEEIKRYMIAQTTPSEYARQLLTKALATTPNLTLTDHSISIDKQGRGTLRLSKHGLDQIDIKPKDRVDITLTKHKAHSTE
jgi:hypothetical protein